MDSPGEQRQSVSLFRSADFTRFFLARTVSATGSSLSLVVLPMLVYQKSHSPALVSAVATIDVLPYLIFGLMAGAMADRVDRKRLMVACDCVCAVAMAVIPASGGLIWLVYAGAGASAAAAVWFDAGSFGAVPVLVGRARLSEANGLVGTASSVAAVAAPAVGGLLASGIGAASTVGLDAASFAISALLLSRVAARLHAAGQDKGADARKLTLRQLRLDISEGASYLWRHSVVRILTLAGAANSLSGGALTGLLVVYAARGLHVPDHGEAIGSLYAADGAGGVAGSLAFSRLSRRVSPGTLAIASLWGIAAMMIGIAMTSRYAIALPAVLVWSALYTTVVLNGITFRQQVIPDSLLSRVNTTARMIAWGGTPFGAAIGGVLAQYLSVRTALLLCCLPVLGGAAAAFSCLKGL